MLRKLSAYPRQNGLAVALREVGRLERSIFILNWLRDMALLHGSAVELGEAIERFQQDTFGVGEAQLIKARNSSERSPNPE